MIRSATISDCETIAEALWNNWTQLKAQQIATPLHAYASSSVLKEEIHHDLKRWLVCESPDSQKTGFFALTPLGSDKIYKKWGFPAQAERIEHFACLLDAEALLCQFQSLAEHLQRRSVLLCFASPLRDVYWAALKAGFKLLGESPMVMGTFVWLYLDREESYDEIQAKLKRAKIIVTS